MGRQDGQDDPEHPVNPVKSFLPDEQGAAIHRKELVMMKGLTVVLCVLIVSAGIAGAEEVKKPRRLLFVVETRGYHHDSTENAIPVVMTLGRTSKAFTTTVTDDASIITGDLLKDYDAVMFFTTGELPMDPIQKNALMAFIKLGKGFIGIHCATDTFYKWPEYGEMIGAYFDGHPWSQDVTIKVEDPYFPGMNRLGKSFVFKEEVYQYKNWSRDKVHVLLSLDNKSVDISQGKRADKDYAMAWCKQWGKGRVLFNGMGHYPEAWNDPRFQNMILEGIRWAMGDLPDRVPTEEPKQNK
jgi:type 1 glutamine amidotransferase